MVNDRGPLFKRDYIPVYITGLIVLILVGVLVFLIFYDQKNDAITMNVPDVPDVKKVELGESEFNGGTQSAEGTDTALAKNASIKFKLITDYFKNGYELSAITADNSKDGILIHSTDYSNIPMVSLVKTNGSIKWNIDAKIKGAKNTYVHKIIYTNKKYYVFVNAQYGEKYQGFVYTVSDSGKKSSSVELTDKSDNKISNVVEDSKGGFAVITEGKENLKVYYIGYDMKNQKTFTLQNQEANIFKSSYPNVVMSNFDKDKLNIIVKYNESYENTNFMVSITDGKSVVINAIPEYEKLENEGIFTTFYNKDNFYIFTNENRLYKLDKNSNVLSKYDYNNLNINITDFSMKEEVDEADLESALKNVYFRNVKLQDNEIIVTYSIANYEFVDILDLNLGLQKRFKLKTDYVEYESSVLVDTLYIDKKINNVYTYGGQTPALMISTIG